MERNPDSPALGNRQAESASGRPSPRMEPAATAGRLAPANEVNPPSPETLAAFSGPERAIVPAVDPLKARGWRSLDSAPWGEEVLLTGKSGYVAPHDRFVVNGYREKGWHQDEWNDATGTRLSEAGWEPTHWMPLSEVSEGGISREVTRQMIDACREVSEWLPLLKQNYPDMAGLIRGCIAAKDAISKLENR